ncbi:DUF6520 family protein [Pedobacter sp. Du54]|uniref:DUF6520 family protein n=1 Tax=Pedobacter anseongensis TaxID=3133439 RepID=UPI00309C6BAB
MKKQFILPVLAVVFAVSGAFASSKFTPIYFSGDDSTCQTPIPAPECTPGESVPCIDENSQGDLPYRYKTDVSDSGCHDLLRD